jgi:hypothetical protein
MVAAVAAFQFDLRWRQLAQGAVDRGAGAAEFLSQLGFGRQQGTLRPDPVLDPAQNFVAHILKTDGPGSRHMSLLI